MHLDHVFPRPTLRRIAEASGGNPFFALEIARTLVDGAAHPGPGEPLPLPGTLAGLLRRRLERLPARTRDVLLLVAAVWAPTVALVRRLAGVDGDAALARAADTGTITIERDRIRFTHPLLASAVYGSATPAARRALHQRLAEAGRDPEERARHLALAAAQAGERAASALDEAAALARRRGAPDAAGELQEQAARLTVGNDGAARRRRTIQAAEYLMHAGDRGRARMLLERALGEIASGAERARALRLLGLIRGQEHGYADAVACLEDALAHAADAPSRVTIRLELAAALFNSGDPPRAVPLAQEALVEAETLGDAGLLADALAQSVVGQFITGFGSDHANLARALALEDRGRGGPLELRPTSLAGIMATWEGRLSDGHALLRAMCDWAADRGEESGLSFLLSNLSWLEWLRGDFAAAVRWADEARVIAEQSGSETMRAVAFVQRGRARAGSGDVAGARADLAEGRRLLEEVGYVQVLPWLFSGEAALELSLGEPEAAVRAIAPLVELVESAAIGGLFVDFAPDGIEALARTGETERAERMLARFTRRADALDRPWARAVAARARSILASAAGDLDAALAAAEEAADGWAFLEMPVERGRALLVLGQVQRRRGDRRLARATLEQARDVFRAVGASLWAARAEDEVRRIPIRRGAARDLTPTEERVAALAAAGRTNAEVAKALFMSPKTVEANLSRIYGKLGIRSRAELGARMLERRTSAEGGG